MKDINQSEIYRLPITEEEQISLHVRLRFVYQEDARWHLHIVLDEFTTVEELRKCWHKIRQARQQLTEYQGTDPTWFSISSMIDIEKQKQNLSYRDIAFDMNFDALVYIIWAADTKGGENMAIAGLSNFVNLLFTFGMKAKDIKEYEEDAKEQLSKGNLPWDLETGPITDRCVIDALRQYKNPQSSKKIVVKEVSASKGFFYRKYMSVDMIRALSLTNKYWLQAKELLEKHRPEQFSKYEERWNQRTAEIIRKDVENFGLNSQ